MKNSVHIAHFHSLSLNLSLYDTHTFPNIIFNNNKRYHIREKSRVLVKRLRFVVKTY